MGWLILLLLGRGRGPGFEELRWPRDVSDLSGLRGLWVALARVTHAALDACVRNAYPGKQWDWLELPLVALWMLARGA